jgi:hypothetical protein
LYLTIIGTTVGIISVGLALRQYFESKELKDMQKELTKLQLEKAQKDKSLSK